MSLSTRNLNHPLFNQVLNFYVHIFSCMRLNHCLKFNILISIGSTWNCHMIQDLYVEEHQNQIFNPIILNAE